MNLETSKNLNSSPDAILPSYDGAKLPSLQPRDQNSDAKSIINPEDNWMPSPFVPNGLPGLEYLTKIDKFVVNQNLDRNMRKINYLIKNDLAQNVYTAVEEYNKCCLTCCSSNRPFDIRILDYQEREVLRFQRPFRSKSCCFPCCLQSVTVTASGNLCGFIKQSWHPFKPKLKICDASGNTVLLIEGPGRFLDSLCLGTNYAGPKFKVLLKDGKTEVGYVSKLLASVVRESFPNAKHFSISFPMDLDVNTKAVLLAASILIDSMYYNTSFRTTERDAASAAFSTGFECGYCLGLCLLH